MKSWSYGINTYHKTASIWLEEGHWYIFFLDRAIEFLCSIIPPIPFPNIGRIIDEGEKYTLKEWWGDLDQWFCCSVHGPITNFCYKRINNFHIDIKYSKCRELFYGKDKRYWDEQESKREDK